MPTILYYLNAYKHIILIHKKFMKLLYFTAGGKQHSFWQCSGAPTRPFSPFRF